MKKFLFVFLLLMIATMCSAEIVEYMDSTATSVIRIPVSDLTPLPTTAVVSIGSITVEVGSPPNENLSNDVIAMPTPANMTSISSRKNFDIFSKSATETAWISLDSSTASAAVGVGIPVFPYGHIGGELDSVKTIGYAASTAVYLSIYQDGF